MATLEEIVVKKEDADLEVKSAQGASGEGAFPQSVWETYSAMANTDGGVILLGVDEDDEGNLVPLGIVDHRKVRKELWDQVNNRQLVSRNILTNSSVQIIELEEVADPIIQIDVPRASRKQKPVYLGSNPFTGTFRRNYEGDYRATESEVRRLIAEAEQDARDGAILRGYGLPDIDPEALEIYRREFRTTNPAHPWADLPDREFLEMLGGYRVDRETGEEGLTLAGVLMFGRFRPIHDAIDHFALDYQDKTDMSEGRRWSDRITTDGAWSGNLFDFSRRVMRRLTQDLKVPFRLEEGAKRIDESPIHEALREALVNALIHADYAGTVPILIEKYPDHFVFRNPGNLRLPREQVYAGGVSDCRNPRIQKMFQLIGASEKAGSGFPKILSAWRTQHWRQPALREGFNPEDVELDLRMISLFPAELVDELIRDYDGFDQLTQDERIAVATAKIEGQVTNRRVRELISAGRYDAGLMLRGLVSKGFLERRGRRGGTYYELADPEQHGYTLGLFESQPEELGEAERDELAEIAEPVSRRERVSPDLMRATILKLCRSKFLPVSELADLLNRSPGTLRSHYLPELVDEGELELRFPHHPSHPQQAYRTSSG